MCTVVWIQFQMIKVCFWNGFSLSVILYTYINKTAQASRIWLPFCLTIENRNIPKLPYVGIDEQCFQYVIEGTSLKVRYDPHPNLITYLITLRYIMNPNPNLITYLNPHPNLRYVITHNVPEKIKDLMLIMYLFSKYLWYF